MTKREIQDIRRLQSPKGRKQQKHFIVEGRKCLESLLSSQYSVQSIYALAGWADEHKELDCTLVSPSELTRISALKTPRDVLAVVQIPALGSVQINNDEGLWMLLDGISDPGNLGTLIRTALWFGFRGVICCNHCADIYNPKTVQATMGALFGIELVQMDTENILDQCSRTNRPLLAADTRGDNLFGLDPKSYKNALLALGSESHGLSKEIRESATHLVGIPGSGKIESLNVTAAGAIIAAFLSSH